MRPVDEQAIPDQGLEPIVVWATERLRDAGLGPQLADTVAREAANDLARILDVTAILELVARGCPPELAVRILDPIEESRRR